jgi:hypothetical protein
MQYALFSLHNCKKAVSQGPSSFIAGGSGRQIGQVWPFSLIAAGDDADIFHPFHLQSAICQHTCKAQNVMYQTNWSKVIVYSSKKERKWQLFMAYRQAIIGELDCSALYSSYSPEHGESHVLSFSLSPPSLSGY